MRAPGAIRCAVLNCGFLPRAAFRASVLVILFTLIAAQLPAKHRRVKSEGTRARTEPAAVAVPPTVPDTQGLDAIIAEMQKPLPPLEEPAQPALVTPPAASLVPRTEGSWQTPVYVFLVCATIVLVAWLLRPARRAVVVEGPVSLPAAPRMPNARELLSNPRPTLLKAIPNPIRAATRLLPPPNSPAPLPALKPVPNKQTGIKSAVNKPAADRPAPKPEAKPEWNGDALTLQEINQLKAQASFASWHELLVAARAGNNLARQILRSHPRHSAICFTLDAEEFKRHLKLARNLEFSDEWMKQILTLLRLTECFDERVEITSPLGQRHEILINAPISSLNTVLGSETLPPGLREQLELRRWILWNTRVDGTEQPEILAAFPLRSAAA